MAWASVTTCLLYRRTSRFSAAGLALKPIPWRKVFELHINEAGNQ
jgi:hypothetical protein